MHGDRKILVEEREIVVMGHEKGLGSNRRCGADLYDAQGKGLSKHGKAENMDKEASSSELLEVSS